MVPIDTLDANAKRVFFQHVYFKLAHRWESQSVNLSTVSSGRDRACLLLPSLLPISSFVGVTGDISLESV